MHLTNKLRNILAVSAMALFFCALPRPASAGIAISITIAPPILPVYTQPPCPLDGYIWTPGYWAWSEAGYYWVPGVWVAPPMVGLLWTPGYWGFAGGNYIWHAGYWGPHIGFYGGVNYGFGYFGVGYAGGFWSGGVFRYNTAVTAVNTTIVRNVYVDRTVSRNTYVVDRTSFNGAGGINARPTPQEQMAIHEAHVAPIPVQVTHERNSSLDRAQFASVNHGQPGTTTMDRINGRRFDQQGRIANGVASGQLTAGETGRLEGREAKLNSEIHADRQANGGSLTPQQKQQINRQQNNLSRSIYDDKHDGANASYGNNEVGARRAEQQQRIAQGVHSGQMSPGEAARSEKTEQNINRQIHTDRQANGGSLTAQERQQINRQQNQASRQISNEKHNDHEAPGEKR